MITVCIATYNGEKYIGEQLASILSQLSSDDEVVVSDDGSTDNTLGVVRGFADNRIRIVDGPHRNSPTLNFENALRHAKGDFIFLADQDDVWVRDKVKVCMNVLKKSDCVVSDAVVTDEKLNVINTSMYNMLNVRQGRLYNLICHNGYSGCCMAFKRKVLEKAIPFPKNAPMHDIWIGNVAAFCFSVGFISDKLIFFRRHKHTISCNGSKSKYSVVQKMLFRWNTIKYILRIKLK